MKKLIFCSLLLLILDAVRAASFTLEDTISLPGVKGRIDHFGIDREGCRLFVAALGNNTVEVVSLKDKEVIHSIKGLAEPQGIFFVTETNRIYVANGGDGTVKLFDGANCVQTDSISLGDDADNVRYDAEAKQVLVGYGGGSLATIDIKSGKIVSDVKLPVHPESFQLEPGGSRAYVNIPKAHKIAVIDRAQNKVIDEWSIGLAGANFPMALDGSNHRLFVGCRTPSRLLIFDTQSGKEVAKLDLHGDCDDLFYDGERKQIYASCGEGYLDVFAQADADHYSLKEAFKTESKARTCYFDGDRIYLAVPLKSEQAAKILSYKINL
ncbi:MAG TPA: YncE family protein [Opitutaceae bacterium]|nr:YncE family protein [Opitutaceae bacterium]